VLRRAFFAGARAARFALPRVPLSELYTGDARRTIEDAGGTVATGAAATSVSIAADRVDAVFLKDGRRLAADAVVLAVPCAALLRLLPPGLRDVAPFPGARRLARPRSSSAHLSCGHASDQGKYVSFHLYRYYPIYSDDES